MIEIEDYIESLIIMHELSEDKKRSSKKYIVTRDLKNLNHLWFTENLFEVYNSSYQIQPAPGTLQKFVVIIIESDFSVTFSLKTSLFGKLFQPLSSYGRLHKGYQDIKKEKYEINFEFNFREISEFKKFFYDVLWKGLKH